MVAYPPPKVNSKAISLVHNKIIKLGKGKQLRWRENNVSENSDAHRGDKDLGTCADDLVKKEKCAPLETAS